MVFTLMVLKVTGFKSGLFGCNALQKDDTFVRLTSGYRLIHM